MEENEEIPFFSIIREDMGPDGELYYIHANPSGLRKYAKSLNEIADDIEKNREFADKKLPDDYWVMGDIHLSDVKIVSEEETPNTRLLEPNNVTTGDFNPPGVGCLLIAIAVLAIFIAGIIAIFKWIS